MVDQISPGLVDGCAHKRQHCHGTDAAYRHCGCRCDACKAARSRARKRPNCRVDAPRARNLLRRLTTTGYSLEQISEASGVSRWTLTRIRTGAQVTTTRATMSRLVAMAALTPAPTKTRAFVTPVGAVRRLQALMARGFSSVFLAGKMGCDPRTVRFVVAEERQLSPQLCQKAGAVYEELWNKDPLAEGMSDHGVSLAMRMAGKYSFVPPLAWDDDAIDDPGSPRPLWAVGPEKRMSSEELCVEILMMQDAGVPIEEATPRLGFIKPGTLGKYSSRHGLPGPYSRYRDPSPGRPFVLGVDELDDVEDLWAA